METGKRKGERGEEEKDMETGNQLYLYAAVSKISKIYAQDGSLFQD